MREGSRFIAQMLFFQKSKEEVTKWCQLLETYFADEKNRKSIELLEMEGPEERSLQVLKTEVGEIPGEGELCLEFLSPFPFKPENGKSRLYISKKHFIQAFEKRFLTLFGKEFKYKSKNDSFDILPYYWHYSEMKHPSKSQPGTFQYINGCVGKFYLKGTFKDFLPFIIMGSEIHSGTKRSNSQGYFRVFCDSLAHLDNYFPDKKAILSVIIDVLEKYDDALETLSRDEMYPFEEEVYAEKLYNEILENSFNPSPNTAFTIKRKNRENRIVEQLSFRDLIVSQYLLKTLNKVFDAFFEEESIGFRKGIPRERAVGLVKSVVDQGFEYVFESDIEAFFTSIDLKKLKKLLDFYLPEKDIRIRSLLEKFIDNGYILKGKYHHRLKGLAQGCSLSPMLANLYLDSFDEKIKALDVRFIRCGDDFIILCKSKEDAEAMLSRSEAFLSQLGLKIKKEKTAIRSVKQGFQFLSMTFTAEGKTPAHEE
jgi:CRISPR-associated protein Cas1